MQDIVYYIFCGMCLGGGLGVILLPGYVNSAMSMLLSMLGVAGLMLMMKAYFLAFIMIMVYAGAVLVLFVFVVMLIGGKSDGISNIRKGILLLLWVALGAVLGYFEPQIFKSCAVEHLRTTAETVAPQCVEVAKNYGLVLFTKFMLPFQIAGVLLLGAMVGAIVIAKQKTTRKSRGDMV